MRPTRAQLQRASRRKASRRGTDGGNRVAENRQARQATLRLQNRKGSEESETSTLSFPLPFRPFAGAALAAPVAPEARPAGSDAPQTVLDQASPPRVQTQTPMPEATSASVVGEFGESTALEQRYCQEAAEAPIASVPHPDAHHSFNSKATQSPRAAAADDDSLCSPRPRRSRSSIGAPIRSSYSSNAGSVAEPAKTVMRRSARRRSMVAGALPPMLGQDPIVEATPPCREKERGGTDGSVSDCSAAKQPLPLAEDDVKNKLEEPLAVACVLLGTVGDADDGENVVCEPTTPAKTGRADNEALQPTAIDVRSSTAVAAEAPIASVPRLDAHHSFDAEATESPRAASASAAAAAAAAAVGGTLCSPRPQRSRSSIGAPIQSSYSSDAGSGSDPAKTVIRKSARRRSMAAGTLPPKPRQDPIVEATPPCREKEGGGTDSGVSDCSAAKQPLPLVERVVQNMLEEPLAAAYISLGAVGDAGDGEVEVCEPAAAKTEKADSKALEPTAIGVRCSTPAVMRRATRSGQAGRSPGGQENQPAQETSTALRRSARRRSIGGFGAFSPARAWANAEGCGNARPVVKSKRTSFDGLDATPAAAAAAAVSAEPQGGASVSARRSACRGKTPTRGKRAERYRTQIRPSGVGDHSEEEPRVGVIAALSKECMAKVAEEGVLARPDGLLDALQVLLAAIEEAEACYLRHESSSSPPEGVNQPAAFPKKMVRFCSFDFSTVDMPLNTTDGSELPAKEIAQGLVLVTHAENLLRQALQHPMREGGGEGEEDELAIWKAFLGELRALAGAPGSATGNSEGRNERKRCGDVEAERRSEKSAAARFLLAELESLEVLEGPVQSVFAERLANLLSSLIRFKLRTLFNAPPEPLSTPAAEVRNRAKFSGTSAGIPGPMHFSKVHRLVELRPETPKRPLPDPFKRWQTYDHTRKPQANSEISKAMRRLHGYPGVEAVECIVAAEGFLSANRDRPLCQEADVTKGLLHLMAAVDAVEAARASRFMRSLLKSDGVKDAIASAGGWSDVEAFASDLQRLNRPGGIDESFTLLSDIHGLEGWLGTRSLWPVRAEEVLKALLDLFRPLTKRTRTSLSKETRELLLETVLDAEQIIVFPDVKVGGAEGEKAPTEQRGQSEESNTPELVSGSTAKKKSAARKRKRRASIM